MQVSWIDADQIKALVAQIEMPAPRMEETPEVVELDTVPSDSSEAWGFAIERQDAPARPAFLPAPPAPEKLEAPAVAPLMPVKFDPQPAFVSDADDEPLEDGGIGQPLQSPASALPLSRIRDKLRAIRQRAADAGILTRANSGVQADATPSIAPDPADGEPQPKRISGAASSSAPMPAPAVRSAKTVFETPRGPREVRLAAFAGWARQVLREDGGSQVLVMRDDGEVLWGGGEAKSGLALSTMMACGAAIRASVLSARETPAIIHQPLASGNILTVIPCETSGGIIHAAVAAPTGLSHEQAHQLRGALCAAMN